MPMCPNGHQNAPGGRYCSTCAAELPPAETAVAPPPPPPPPPAPPAGPPTAGRELPWYHRTWVVAAGLLVCAPFGLWALWTHPSWSRSAKQRLTLAVGALLVIGAIANAVSPDDASDDRAASVVTRQRAPRTPTTHEGTTTTTQPRTTTTEATTTTLDREVLRAAYDAQVAASCETVAHASLAEDDSLLALAEGVHYDTAWTPHAPKARFLQDVQYCGHQRREERRATECGRRPEVELLSRDPDKFAGQCFTVVMNIVQFDQGTGKCAFRAHFDTVAREWNFEYKGDNALMVYPEPCPQLDALGTDDVIRTRAVVVGGLTYDTTIGGSATAVQFVPVGDPEILQNN